MRLTPGDSLVITGRSGSGKTTLLRSLAQLWPYASGTVRYPDDENETMFLSQLPYMPLGDLRAVVSYPAEAGDIDDATIRAALDTVALGHLEARLDEGFDWAKVLSPGEQQRIAFARVLLTKPRAVFLDESTSALDEGQEFALYRALRTELPDCIVVSVSHRPTVEQHHDRHLELLGGGEWRLGRVGELRRSSSALASDAGSATRRVMRAAASLGAEAQPGRVFAGAAAEERPFAELGAAGVALAVLGDVRRAGAGRVQTRDGAAILAAAPRRRRRWPVRPW